MTIRVRHLALLALIVSFFLASLWNASVARMIRPHLQDDRRIVTYRFTARVKTNDGVLPFKVGELMDGNFTYDLRGKSRYPDDTVHPRRALDSPRNALSFQIGGQRFFGSGNILVTVSDMKLAEHFGIVAPDLELPQGWEMEHGGPSQTYGVLFQNAPAKGVIMPAGIPERLWLPSFVNTRELHLDFFHGVRFPEGQVKGRAVVIADIETLEDVRNSEGR